ncbi:MAG: BrnT family toxin [Janthinobacterium lividum]
MELSFEWDDIKSRSNLDKHGVTFAEAATVFGDPLSILIPDPLHSEDEDRWTLLGQSQKQRLLVVAHMERGGAVRLISARLATAKEKRNYEEG